jgi:hypothetical protein
MVTVHCTCIWIHQKRGECRESLYLISTGSYFTPYSMKINTICTVGSYAPHSGVLCYNNKCYYRGLFDFSFLSDQYDNFQRPLADGAVFYFSREVWLTTFFGPFSNGHCISVDYSFLCLLTSKILISFFRSVASSYFSGLHFGGHSGGPGTGIGHYYPGGMGGHHLNRLEVGADVHATRYSHHPNTISNGNQKTIWKQAMCLVFECSLSKTILCIKYY